MGQIESGSGAWVAILVERGYISEAKLYRTKGNAMRRVRAWRASINPDYDEASAIKIQMPKSRGSIQT